MSQDQLNDMQPSDRTSDTEPANAPQSTPTLRESIEIILDTSFEDFDYPSPKGPVSAFALTIEELESLLSDRIREAEKQQRLWVAALLRSQGGKVVIGRRYFVETDSKDVVTVYDDPATYAVVYKLEAALQEKQS